MGVMSGPLSPVNPKTGKTVSVMAVDCMLAGPLESRFLMMYWITQKRPLPALVFLSGLHRRVFSVSFWDEI